MAGGKRILIADDDHDIIDLLESYFKLQGYDVAVALDGKEVLRLIEEERFDLVLLDVMMPYINGYRVAHEITSKTAQGPAPKIVIMTSREISSERGIALLSGANDVIQKPFSLEDIERKVRAVLSL